MDQGKLKDIGQDLYNRWYNEQASYNPVRTGFNAFKNDTGFWSGLGISSNDGYDLTKAANSYINNPNTGNVQREKEALDLYNKYLTGENNLDITPLTDLAKSYMPQENVSIPIQEMAANIDPDYIAPSLILQKYSKQETPEYKEDTLISPDDAFGEESIARGMLKYLK